MQEPYFNIIYEDKNIIIPEVEDEELLQFSLVFMDIFRRELGNMRGYNLNIDRGK